MEDVRETILLASVEAQERPRLTRHILAKTNLTVPEAIALLRTTPVEPPSLDERMAGQEGMGGAPVPALTGQEAIAKLWKVSITRVNAQYGRKS